MLNAKMIVKRFDMDIKGWELITFQSLVRGNIYRMYDPYTGAPYTDEKGNEVFIADSDPFVNSDGVWAVQTVPVMLEVKVTRIVKK